MNNNYSTHTHPYTYGAAITLKLELSTLKPISPELLFLSYQPHPPSSSSMRRSQCDQCIALSGNTYSLAASGTRRERVILTKLVNLANGVVRSSVACSTATAIPRQGGERKWNALDPMTNCLATLSIIFLLWNSTPRSNPLWSVIRLHPEGPRPMISCLSPAVNPRLQSGYEISSSFAKATNKVVQPRTT